MQLNAPKDILLRRLHLNRRGEAVQLQLRLNPEIDLATWYERLFATAMQTQSASGKVIHVHCEVILAPSQMQPDGDGIVDVLRSGEHGIWCMGTVVHPTSSDGPTVPFDLGTAVLRVFANVAWSRDMWRPIVCALPL